MKIVKVGMPVLMILISVTFLISSLRFQRPILGIQMVHYIFQSG